MKQHILFVDQTSSWGGAQRVLDIVLDSLAGEFIPIVALPEGGPFAKELRLKRVETLNLPLGSYRSGKKTLLDMMTFAPRSLLCAAQLAQTIYRRNIRLVYINGPRCLAAGVLAGRWAGVPLLFHVHLTMTRATEVFMMRLAAPGAAEIVACCEAAAAPLLKIYPALRRKLHIVYNPVRALVSKTAAARRATRTAISNSRRPVIGLVGRICPQKRQHILLQAAARLKDRGRDVQIVFLGSPGDNNSEDAAYASFLKSSAQRLGLEEQVEWAGYQSDPNPYYAVFDILAIPSTASEGLPLAALEALRWGIPVIASPIGGIPELIHHGVNGLIVPPLDDKALAESLGQILSDPDLRSRLELGARVTIDSRFSVETFTDSIRKVVSRLCESDKTAANRKQERQLEARL